MNTLLNTCNAFPVLRTDSLNTNVNAYSNFLSPSLVTANGCAGDNLSQALANVPSNSYGYGAGFGQSAYSAPAQSSSNLKALVDQGIISNDEYKNQIRRSLGLSSFGTESNDSTPQEAFGALSGKALEKAQKSHSGAFKTTDAHSQMASQIVEQVKEVLKKDPSEVTEEEAEAIKKVFSDLNKNPMIAEAFIKEANETSFRSENGKTTNLLASYEQVLTKLHGRKEAKESIGEIKSGLVKTLGSRSPEAIKEFGKDYQAQQGNVNYSFLDRLKSKSAAHPFATATLGVTAAGAGTYGAYKAARLVGMKNMLKAGKFGAISAGVVALGASAYTLIKD